MTQGRENFITRQFAEDFPDVPTRTKLLIKGGALSYEDACECLGKWYDRIVRKEESK